MGLTLVFALVGTVMVVLAGLMLRLKKTKRPSQPAPALLESAVEEPFLDTGWLSEALERLGDPARLEEPSPRIWLIPSLHKAPELALELELCSAEEGPSQLRLKLTRAMPKHAATWQWDSADEQRCCVTLNNRKLRGPEPLIFSEHPMLLQAFRSLLNRAEIERLQLTDRPKTQSIEAKATFRTPAVQALLSSIYELSMALKFIPPQAFDEALFWVKLARHPLALTEDRDRSRRALDHLDALTLKEQRASILAAWSTYKEPTFWLAAFEQLSTWEPHAALSTERLRQLFEQWQQQGLITDHELGALAARILHVEALASFEDANWYEDWLGALIQQTLTKLGRARTTNPRATAYNHIEQHVRAESVWLEQWPSHRMPDPGSANASSALHTLRVKIYEGLSSVDPNENIRTLEFLAKTHFILTSDLLLCFSRGINEHHINDRERLLHATLTTIKTWYSEHSTLEIYSSAQRRVLEDALLDHAQGWMGWEPLLCEVLGRIGDLDTLKAMSHALTEEYGVKAKPTPAMYALAKRLQDRTGTFYENLAEPKAGGLSLSRISGALSLGDDKSS